MRGFWIASLLAGTALAALAGPADAADKKQVPATRQPDPRIGVLEQELRDIQLQLSKIKGAQADQPDYSAAVLDLKRSTSDQYADLNTQLAAQTKTSIPNGRLSFASADGAFTLALRSLVQFDYGYFSQSKNPASVDLSSGSNFRRAQLGIQGTAWRDWSYNFTYDFGGNGVEKSGYIYYAYIEYDGLKPFAIRAGAMTPFIDIEDSTGSGDLLFLERPASVDVSRNIAGAPGREGVEVFAQGDTYLVSLAYTGKKATDAASFDAQEALVGRATYLAINQPDLKWLLGGHFTHVLHPPDVAPNTNASNVFSFSNGPELAVDSTKTINTGNIDANTVTEFGFESAAEYAGFFGQGGWFHYEIDRRTTLPSPHFSGWYGTLTYSLTGEQHPYDPTTASFRSLRPDHPLGTPGGWGAWEVKARYSDIDLDFLPFNSAVTGGVAGGRQDVWSVGLNWYPTNGLRFALDYDNIQVNHANAPATDISASAIALRSQISF
jgi:phosphate-selective porin OprO and OprP